MSICGLCIHYRVYGHRLEGQDLHDCCKKDKRCDDKTYCRTCPSPVINHNSPACKDFETGWKGGDHAVKT